MLPDPSRVPDGKKGDLADVQKFIAELEAALDTLGAKVAALQATEDLAASGKLPQSWA